MVRGGGGGEGGGGLCWLGFGGRGVVVVVESV